ARDGRSPAHRLAERRALEAAGLEPAVALLQRADVGLELLDVRAARHGLRVVARELLAAAGEIGHDAVGLARGARDLVARAGERVAQHGEVALAGLHLLHEAVDLGAEDIGLSQTYGAAAGVEEDHRAENAADAAANGRTQVTKAATQPSPAPTAVPNDLEP